MSLASSTKENKTNKKEVGLKKKDAWIDEKLEIIYS